MGKINDIAKRNWIFVVFIVVVLFVYCRRYNYLSTSVVSFPDEQIVFSMQEETIEQTWQPLAKMISGVSFPFYTENSFTADIELSICSDDYSQVLRQQTITGYEFTSGESGSVEFDFQRTKVVQGERYHFVFRFTNPSAEGAICIPSGSNYGGCTIQGVDQGQAIALNIKFVKFSKLFWLMAILFPLLCNSFLCMMLWEKKWEECVGLSVLMEGVILYAFGWMNHLTYGIRCIFALAIIGLGLGIWLYNKKGKNIRDLLSPGLFIFFAFFIVILLTNAGDWLGNRDELRHWGIAVRDMFFYDSFATHPGTTVILPRYLPFTAIIEYLFVYLNGLFSEDILFIAYQIMLLSMLIILCKPLSHKEGKKYIFPVFVAMICVPIIFFNNISSCIMVDSLQAAIMAYILICYFVDGLTKSNVFRITMSLMALVLIKDIGLIFGGMMVLIMGGDIVALQIKEKKLQLRKLLYPICGLLFILGVYLSWQVYLNKPVKSVVVNTPAVQEQSDITKQNISSQEYAKETIQTVSETQDALSASNISIPGLIEIFKGNGEDYQYQTTRNLLTELFDGETYSFMSWKFSFVDLMVIVSLAIVLCGGMSYWKREKIRLGFMTVTVILAGLCLCTFLQVTYWFSFGRYDGVALTSLSRYLAPYLCCLFIVILYLAMMGLSSCGDDKKNKSVLYGICLFLLMSMPVAGIVTESKDIENNTTEENTYGHDRLAEILHSVARKGERTYFICSNSDGYSEYIFRNEVCPIISEHENWNIVANEELFKRQDDLYGDNLNPNNIAKILTREAWEYQLWECEYVVVFHADELFKESYAKVFGNSENIQDGSVYRVEKENGEINLAMIGQTGIKGWR